MKRVKTIAKPTVLLALCSPFMSAQCVPTAGNYFYNSVGCIGPPPGGSACAPNAGSLCAQGQWTGVTFPDGWLASPTPSVTGSGQKATYYGDCQQASGPCYNASLVSCPPKFDAIEISGGFIANAYDQTASITRLQCGVVQYNYYVSCSNNTVVSRIYTVSHTCGFSCTGNPTFVCSSSGGVGYVNAT